jgi:hypothetical protein
MAIQLLDQETQLRRTFPVNLYDDTVVPSEANYETNPASLMDDLNNIRSQMYNLLKNQTSGNWYDDLNTPSTLESGVQRGVNDLNDALHLLEKKRVLRQVKLLDDVTVPTGVAAAGTLTSTGAFSDGETVTIGSTVYTMRSPFVDAAFNIDASGTQAQTHENLRRAINLDGVAGTNYGTGTTVHPDVTAADTATTNVITANVEGTAANLIATTETGANMAFGAATLQNGAGDVVILGSGELPTQTTAAVGAVTTLGTVVATATNFGTAGLDEVAGLHALSPHNLLEIVDGSTGDPILSTEGKRVWGLLQGESGVTDGATITDTTTTRVQIAFVHGNATNDDLIQADGVDIGGKTVNYCYRERIRLEDLNEGDFLNSAAVDIGAGAVTPTRQIGYDNQGTTPVDLVTNATLDLEGAGLEWKIRDDLEADLFGVVEGSAGGTSQVNIYGDVDEFDVDAVVNDFLNGASFDTGAAGTTINVGVTANQIDSGGALTLQSASATILRMDAGGLLEFGDTNEAASTYDTPLVLSDTSQEWSDFETKFGEVSLLNAICQAQGDTNRRTVVAICTVAAAADADVSGPSNDNNLDTDLGDLSGHDFGLSTTKLDISLNGAIQVQDSDTGGANDKDVYPGTSLANGQLKFEKKIKVGDVIYIVDWLELP